MVHRLYQKKSILNHYIAEMRDVNIQSDRAKFRRNMRRVGQIMAMEISKHLKYQAKEVETPLGVADCERLDDRIVLGTILRAGLPLHEGLLSYFDDAENAFISAYRHHHKDGTFEIRMEYITCPNIDDKILILCDPMLATGASMQKTLEAIEEYGKPKQIHIVTVIASTNGIDYIKRMHGDANIWIAAEDEELTAKSYIVPGLGDAGDLAYGAKLQD